MPPGVLNTHCWEILLRHLDHCEELRLIIFFSLIVGAFGTYRTTISVISAEVVGLQLLLSALSIVWISLIVPSTFAEAIGLQLKRKRGIFIFMHKSSQRLCI
jgi:hypothetical protein